MIDFIRLTLFNTLVQSNGSVFNGLNLFDIVPNLETAEAIMPKVSLLTTPSEIPFHLLMAISSATYLILLIFVPNVSTSAFNLGI